MSKLRVGVLFGGRSGEHEVSLVSAAAILAGLNRSKYDVVPIGISRRGEWRLGRGNWAPAAVLSRGREMCWPPEPRTRRGGQGGQPPPLDVVFPVLHGPWGEDGTVQGFLELAGVPYVGAGVLGSAAAMDKDVMKRLFLQAGLPSVAYERVDRHVWQASPRQVTAKLERRLRYPLFVKPANLGSSVGISKVHERAELGPAMDLAASFDTKVVVEQGIEAREFECSVLGNEFPEASLAGEVIPGQEFYSYEAKYLDAGSRTLIPAPISARLNKRIQAAAVAAFQAVECRGLARVDFFVDKGTGELYVNEINTMPGFTPISMYPKLWAASGVPFPALLDRLIGLALDWSRKQPGGHWPAAAPAKSMVK